MAGGEVGADSQILFAPLANDARLTVKTFLKGREEGRETEEDTSVLIKGVISNCSDSLLTHNLANVSYITWCVVVRSRSWYLSVQCLQKVLSI